MHDHDHHRPVDISTVSRVLIIGIFLNVAYVVVELIAGFISGSLALLADAWHNFADASGLFLAWLAFRLVKIKVTPTNTYGHRKSSILISVANSLLIVAAVTLILREAAYRLQHHREFDGYFISAVAGVGVIVNFLTAYLLHRSRKKDLNLKAAYLHMVADGLVSVGVIIGGFAIAWTQLYWIDPAISAIIGIVVLFSTWSLLRDSLRLAGDSIPMGIEIKAVVHEISSVDGIIAVHHLHVWPLSTAENALTAHIVIPKSISPGEIDRIRKNIKHHLEHLNITHSTLEFEFADHECAHPHCN